MKVLVIPDIHLKPWMFERASSLLKEGIASRAVCLMDIPDDWGQQMNIDLYIRTYDAAIAFARAYPETLWCYGNHDVCYLWGQRESGYSVAAAQTVCRKLGALQKELEDGQRLAFVHRIDNVLFCHGGIANEFVYEHIPVKDYDDTDKVVKTINSFGCREMWKDISPVWYRPQYSEVKMYKDEEMLQVVGHTPVEDVKRKRNVLSCDVFSAYRDGTPIGTRTFPVLDTETWDHQCV